MKFLRIFVPIIAVLVLSYWAFRPLIIPGFFPIHDDTQVARVFEMTKSLRDGMFPVRWVSDLGYGYGYPIFNFYAPLVYYVGALFQLLSFDALIATKLMMGMGIILSGIFMYLLGKEFWGKLGGIVSAAFYLYAPYHAVDIYVRGDTAEFWAYALIPLVFLGFYKVFKSRGSYSWIVIGSLSYAGVILSHNLTAMMITPFLLSAVLIMIAVSYRRKDRKTVISLLVSLGLGLLLSAFYFIPALAEQGYTNVLSQIGGGADYKDHFVCLSQLWQSPWGFGGSAPGCFDGISFMIGKVQIFTTLAVLVLTFILAKKKKESNAVKIVILCFLGLVASTLLTLSISKPLWDHVALMAFLQYPWRFLIFISFFSSLLAGGMVYLSKSLISNKWIQYLVAASLIGAILIINIKFFSPQYIKNITADSYTNDKTLKWTTSKISDEYMPKNFLKPKSENDVVVSKVTFNSNDVKIKSSYQSTRNIMLDMEVFKQTKIHFNIAYFPSWRLTVDGNSKGSIVNRGYDVVIPTGHHRVEMKFVESTPQMLSDLLTVSGLAVLIIGIILGRRKTIYA